jgi:hypothetical protein
LADFFAKLIDGKALTDRQREVLSLLDRILLRLLLACGGLILFGLLVEWFFALAGIAALAAFVVVIVRRVLYLNWAFPEQPGRRDDRA